MRYNGYRLVSLVTLLLVFILANAAQAYLAIGSISYIVQFLVAIGIGGVLSMRFVWSGASRLINKVLSIIKRKKNNINE